MKTIFALATVVALSLGALAQNSPPLASAQIPLRAAAPTLFAPRGWNIEHQIFGDLNRDKIPDAVLVLVEARPVKDTPGELPNRARALVVVLREGKGFRRAGFNNSLLLGTRDGGAFWGVMQTPVEVSIKKGVLHVEQESGSRVLTTTTHKFRLDKRSEGFYLIGYDLKQYDRGDGGLHNQSDNYLTGLQKISDVEGKRGGASRKNRRVSRKLRPLESVKIEERYSG